jgi:hypothetical protein
MPTVAHSPSRRSHRAINFAVCTCVLASLAGAGCGTTISVAPGPAANTVYLTKTHVFLIFAHSRVDVCSMGGATISACHGVTIE